MQTAMTDETVAPTWLHRLTVVETLDGPSSAVSAWTAGYYVKGKYQIKGVYVSYAEAVARCDRENGDDES